MAKTDIDDATGVTSAEADRSAQSSREALSLMLDAISLVRSGQSQEVPITIVVGEEKLHTTPRQLSFALNDLSDNAIEVMHRALENQSLPDDPQVQVSINQRLVFQQEPNHYRDGSAKRYMHPDFASQEFKAALQLAQERAANGDTERTERERDDETTTELAVSPSGVKVGRTLPDYDAEAVQLQAEDIGTLAQVDTPASGEGRMAKKPEPEQIWTTEAVPLSFAEAIAGQNEGDVSTDDAAIWMAQPTTPTVTKDGNGRFVRSPSMEGLEATADLVERKEDQAGWIQERLQNQQDNADQQLATMFDRCLEISFGEEGSATIVGNRYVISRDGLGGLSVTAKDGRGVIFERDNQSGDISSAVTAQDLKVFAAGAAILEQQQMRDIPSRSQKSIPASRPSQQMEIG